MSGYLDWSPRVFPVSFFFVCFVFYGIHPSCPPVVVSLYQIGKMAEVTSLLEHMQGFIVYVLRLFRTCGESVLQRMFLNAFSYCLYIFFICVFNLIYFFFTRLYVLFCFCTYIYEYIPKWFALDMSALIGLFFPLISLHCKCQMRFFFFFK